MSSDSYLLAGQASELDRLQLQSRVWEPAGQRLLDEIGDGRGARAVDIGCGAMGWLRLLSEWVGPEGEVVGTDIDEAMLAAAERFVTAEGLGNVTLVKDDLLASELEPSSFDLVHARFQLGPLGRGTEQMATHLRLVCPGGTVALEEPDPASWHFIPPAPALVVQLRRGVEVQGLIPLGEAFRKAGGDPDAYITQLELFRSAGIEPKTGPRSRRCLRAIPTCGYHSSSLQLSTGCCARLSMPTSWSGSSKRRRASSRTQAGGDSCSRSSNAGAGVGPSARHASRRPWGSGKRTRERKAIMKVEESIVIHRSRGEA